jgi:hypothetical protein
MAVMIVCHADDELLFDPHQEVPEVKASRIEALNKVDE